MKQLSEWTDEELDQAVAEKNRRTAAREAAAWKAEDDARQERVQVLIKQLKEKYDLPMYVFKRGKIMWLKKPWGFDDSDEKYVWELLMSKNVLNVHFRSDSAFNNMCNIVDKIQKQFNEQKFGNSEWVFYDWKDASGDDRGFIRYFVRPAGKIREVTV